MIQTIAAYTSIAAAFLFSLVIGVQTKATRCGTHEGIDYCYYAGAPESQTLIYFLHGFANDQTSWSWNSVTKKIELSWQATKTPHPAVVALTFGRFWWYTRKEQGEKLKAFTEWVENRELGHPAKDRVLYGDSMGGHNAFRWASDQPRLFSRMALICPAIPSAFLGSETPKAGLWPLNWVANAVIVGRYSENGQPFQSPLKELASHGKADLVPEIYIVASSHDQFDFYRGDVALYDSLRKAGIKIELEEQDVIHCNIEASRIAAFLAH